MRASTVRNLRVAINIGDRSKSIAFFHISFLLQFNLHVKYIHDISKQVCFPLKDSQLAQVQGGLKGFRVAWRRGRGERGGGVGGRQGGGGRRWQIGLISDAGGVPNRGGGRI